MRRAAISLLSAKCAARSPSGLIPHLFPLKICRWVMTTVLLTTIDLSYCRCWLGLGIQNGLLSHALHSVSRNFKEDNTPVTSLLRYGIAVIISTMLTGTRSIGLNDLVKVLDCISTSCPESYPSNEPQLDQYVAHSPVPFTTSTKALAMTRSVCSLGCSSSYHRKLSGLGFKAQLPPVLLQ